MFQPGKLLTLSIITFLMALPCGAAIALDTAVDGGNNGGTTNSLSWNHTVTGNNTLLVVCLLGASISSGQDDITSATSGGTNLTLAKKYTGAGSNNNGFSYIYILPNAPTGTHSISFTTTNNHFLIGTSVSYTGTSPVQPDNTAVFPASGSNPFTTSITTIVNNAWVFTCEGANTSGPSSGCTQRVKGAAFNEPVSYDNGAAVSPPASVSCSTESNIVTNNDVHIMMSIAPPSGCSALKVNPVTGKLDCVGLGSTCGKLVINPTTSVLDCVGIDSVVGRFVPNPVTGNFDGTGL